MAPTVVDAIISGEIKSAEKLRPHASEVVEWLKQNLPLAHDDKDLKRRIKLLLGAPLLTPNLAHFGLWDYLIMDCRSKALLMGNEMKQYFTDSDLGTILGPVALPNECGKVQCRRFWQDHGSDYFLVVPADAGDCTTRQDSVLPKFPWKVECSQLFNELCFIHCLRMLAMGIDDSYQEAVEGVCINSNGSFKRAPIKGHVRMKNKCTSKDDHYFEECPRYSAMHFRV